jgi:hypothetical protein
VSPSVSSNSRFVPGWKGDCSATDIKGSRHWLNASATGPVRLSSVREQLEALPGIDGATQGEGDVQDNCLCRVCRLLCAVWRSRGLIQATNEELLFVS